MAVINDNKINYSLEEPKRENFKTFNEYFKRKCEYLVEKYKETYIKE